LRTARPRVKEAAKQAASEALHQPREG
jgi:hypothetical protein